MLLFDMLAYAIRYTWKYVHAWNQSHLCQKKKLKKNVHAGGGSMLHSVLVSCFQKWWLIWGGYWNIIIGSDEVWTLEQDMFLMFECCLCYNWAFGAFGVEVDGHLRLLVELQLDAAAMSFYRFNSGLVDLCWAICKRGELTAVAALF